MNIVEWMTPPIIGSLIGYFTNWLAIKMLFRPYTEKRFLGMKVPFTPGLIPKEKKRLGKKVGNAVGEHLLTEEVIVNALTDPNIQKELKKAIAQSILYLQQDQDTIDHGVTRLLGDQKEEILQGLDRSLASFLMKQMRNSNVQEKTIQLIMERIEAIVKDTSLLDSFSYGRELLLTRGIQYMEGESFRAQLEKWIHDNIHRLESNTNTLGTVVPDVMIKGIKEFVADQGPTIAGQIGTFLDKPDTEERIKTTMIDFVNNHFGKLAMMFMNVDKIYSGLMEELKKYLQDEQNQKGIVVVIQEYIDKVLDERVCDLMGRIPEELKEDTIIEGLQWGLDHIITKENIKKGIEHFEEYLEKKEEKQLFYLLNKMDPEFLGKIKRYLQKQLQTFVEKNPLEQRIEIWIKEERDKFFQRKIQEVTDFIKPSFIDRFGDILLRNLKDMLLNQSAYMIELIDIPRIVEKQINSFEVEYTEQIIVSIAQKELRAITWFGALLGFIMAIILNFI